jgi:hypothetical protein
MAAPEAELDLQLGLGELDITGTDHSFEDVDGHIQANLEDEIVKEALDKVLPISPGTVRPSFPLLCHPDTAGDDAVRRRQHAHRTARLPRGGGGSTAPFPRTWVGSLHLFKHPDIDSSPRTHTHTHTRSLPPPPMRTRGSTSGCTRDKSSRNYTRLSERLSTIMFRRVHTWPHCTAKFKYAHC